MRRQAEMAPFQMRALHAACVFVMLCVILSPSARGQGTGQPLAPENLAAFFDAIMPQEMKTRHAPGAVVVIVSEGKVVFQQGYGVSDLKSGKAVDAEKTLFKVASISKIVTTIGTLRLVDQGKLSLTADLNQYLKTFQLAPTFAQPVTLQNLLTHTGGFDEREIGFTARTREEEKPLGEYLATRMPARVVPPGKYYSYSNHGFALAGYVGECVSGEPYAQFVADEVFKPLKMEHSSFGFEPRLMPELATGYVWEKGKYEESGLDYPNVTPAVSLIATGADLGKIVGTILEKGAWEGERILSEERAKLMLERQFTHDARLPGVTLGFYETSHGKDRLLIQNGEWFGAASLMVLVPERRLGYLIAVNSEEVSITYSVLGKFLDEFLSKEDKGTEQVSQGVPEANLAGYQGSYIMEHYARNSVEKLAELMRESRVEESGKEGRLKITTTDTGTFEALPAGQDHFRAIPRGPGVAFEKDGSGKVTHMFVDHQPFRRFAWYELPRLHLGLFALFGLVFGLAMLGWPVQRIWISRRAVGFPSGQGMARWLKWASLLGLLNVVFLAGMALAFYFREPLGYFYGMPILMVVLLYIPPVTGVLGVILLVAASFRWKSADGTPRARVLLCLVAIVSLLFLPFLSYWNLLGIHS